MIKVKDLHFTYPGKRESTLKGMDFQVQEGEIFGFLGPSGAGKSTSQKILTGILKDYSGQVSVDGEEIRDINREFYNTIGVSFELPNLYSKLTGRENLDFFASLYAKKPLPVSEILEQVGLEGDGDKRVSDYSKGMKMRLNFCRAIIHNPKLLFLDEPTSGLDPVNARKIKDIILKMKAEGKTIFLTTHNMNTADELCDRVAFINEGELALIDTPRALKLGAGEKSLSLDYHWDGKLESRSFPLKGLGKNKEFLDLLNTKEIETIHTREASLEDIFIKTTGRELI